MAYFRGMEAAGVIATAKHFPGHGAADRDSHGFLPIVRVPWQTLWERDLVPYRVLVREGLARGDERAPRPFPDIHGDVIPTSLSPFLLDDVLRRRLGFDGVIVTDDMEMHGVHQGGRDAAEVMPARAARRATTWCCSRTPRSCRTRPGSAFRKLVLPRRRIPPSGGRGGAARAAAQAASPAGRPAAAGRRRSGVRAGPRRGLGGILSLLRRPGP